MSGSACGARFPKGDAQIRKWAGTTRLHAIWHPTRCNYSHEGTHPPEDRGRISKETGQPHHKTAHWARFAPDNRGTCLAQRVNLRSVKYLRVRRTSPIVESAASMRSLFLATVLVVVSAAPLAADPRDDAKAYVKGG